MTDVTVRKGERSTFAHCLLSPQVVELDLSLLQLLVQINIVSGGQ